jgi:hypothetical protein
MATTDGYAVVMHARPGADGAALTHVWVGLASLLGGRLVGSTVVDGTVLTVRISAASHLTARCAVSSALQAMGSTDVVLAAESVVRPASRNLSTPAVTHGATTRSRELHGTPERGQTNPLGTANGPV